MRIRPPAVLLCLIASACSASSANGDGLKIVASVYPVEFVLQEIAGDRAEVVNLTPPGAEPHDVELASEQVIDIAEADLVIFLGEGFQPAIEEAVGEAGGVTLDVLKHIDRPLPGDADEGLAVDPHFWLDPNRLVEASAAITDALSEIDPDGADHYAAATTELNTRLARLDQRLVRLAGCPRHDLVTTHESFGYLAEHLQLEQVGIAGLDPENEPSPQRLAEVADFVRDEGVETIFFETLLPPDVAETIARETGAGTAVLDPLESEPETGDYFSAMETNLDNLKDALGCR